MNQVESDSELHFSALKRFLAHIREVTKPPSIADAVGEHIISQIMTIRVKKSLTYNEHIYSYGRDGRRIPLK
ncbi:hypothetical protein KBD75_02410 [Candidatus Woesebacteria bacterium]|nr:hypothetical protein [Candidatus Woesebacteria bacterium]